MVIKIYNSLSRKIENFSPINKNGVGMYTCGPTVYGYAHVGNWRTYILSDIVRRTFEYFGYSINSVMNITDVGHLTSDGDTGNDKMEEASRKERKGSFEIAKFYTDDFVLGMKKLNLGLSTKLVKATEHIQEQIDLIKKLEEKKLTYKISDGIYFDTVLFEKLGFKYGELSDLDKIREGARVPINSEKKNSRDFALWKFNTTNTKRDTEWESPWGVGFPGWHIECSAMSMKYLGEQFDIHIGGEDLRSTHHSNEIAQSESATGKKPFSKYWIHGAFLQVDGGKMGKSLGNGYTLADLDKIKVHPLSFRYFTFTSHYRSPLNFTWDTVHGAQKTLERLFLKCINLPETDESDSKVLASFEEKIANDFNLPEALAVLQEARSKFAIQKMDSVFGLDIFQNIEKMQDLPLSARDLASQRNEYRERSDWGKSDSLRKELENMGYLVQDDGKKTLVLRGLLLLKD